MFSVLCWTYEIKLDLLMTGFIDCDHSYLDNYLKTIQTITCLLCIVSFFLSINLVIAMVFSAFKKDIAALGILVDSSVPFEIRIFCFIL